jgi:hypothetical protein
MSRNIKARNEYVLVLAIALLVAFIWLEMAVIMAVSLLAK